MSILASTELEPSPYILHISFFVCHFIFHFIFYFSFHFVFHFTLHFVFHFVIHFLVHLYVYMFYTALHITICAICMYRPKSPICHMADGISTCHIYIYPILNYVYRNWNIIYTFVFKPCLVKVDYIDNNQVMCGYSFVHV